MATKASDPTQGLVTLDLSKQPTLPEDHATIEQIAKSFQVTSEEEYHMAAQMIQMAASNIAKVEGFFEGTSDNPGIKVLAYRAHKAICDKIALITKPWRAVRPQIEPRMIRFRQDQERKRREEEERQRRLSEESQRAARAEADRIAREAEDVAQKLRQAGEIRESREVVEAALQVGAAMVEQATALADVGVIMPSAAPVVAGIGESRPWVGIVDDALALVRAVAAGTVPLMHEMPKRGGGTEMVPILEVNAQVVGYVAKRLRSENIGLPGCRGEQSFGLRVSTKGTPPNGGERVAPLPDAGDWS